MARRRDRSKRTQLHLVPESPLLSPLRLDLRLFEDRRLFHPAAFGRPVETFSRRDQRKLVERPPLRPSVYRDPFPSLRLGFAVPEKVVRCVRRKQRREVMFAEKLRHKGSGAKFRRRDQWSNVRC